MQGLARVPIRRAKPKMKRVYFATSDSESGSASSAGQPNSSRPRVAVFVEMAGGYASAALDKKQLGESVKRPELLRGFERGLPDGSTLRVQAFTLPRSTPEPEPNPVPEAEAAPKSRLEIWKEIEAGTTGKPGVATPEPTKFDSLPMFSPPAFEPYRVRAWIGERELREVVGQAGREDSRIVLALLLLIGISETIIGARIWGFPNGGFTRLLFTGPVFLLSAVGVWRKWKWSVPLAMVVAIADTVTFVAKATQENNLSAFLLTVAARLVLIAALSRLRKSGW